jgi:hypothetical protein
MDRGMTPDGGRAMSQYLHPDRRDDGTIAMVPFPGMRHLSSEMLGIQAGMEREMGTVRASIALCDLDALLRDILRITRPDRVFDVCGDEAEGLVLMLRI